jgi:hypothetical protein
MPITDLKLISCVDVTRELGLLGHFVRHYTELGIDPQNMHILLNAEDPDAQGFARAEKILSDFGAAAPTRWVAPYTSDAMWQQRRDLQKRVAKPSDWVLSADIDEFHEYPTDLATVLRHCSAVGATVVQGVFVDRLSADTQLRPVADEPPLKDQFPTEAFIMEAIAGPDSDRYGSVKIMLMRGDIMPSRGGHHPLGDQKFKYLAGAPLGSIPKLSDPRIRLRYPFAVHHFKWTKTLVEGLERRLATEGVSEAGKCYGARVLDAWSNGRLAPENIPAISAADRRAAWRMRMATGRILARVSR